MLFMLCCFGEISQHGILLRQDKQNESSAHSSLSTTEQIEHWFWLASLLIFHFGSFSLSLTHKAGFYLTLYPRYAGLQPRLKQLYSFISVSSISDYYSSIQPFLHRWSKGSDCPDRPWHPASKSCWVERLGTHHIQNMLQAQSLLCLCLFLPAA